MSSLCYKIHFTELFTYIPFINELNYNREFYHTMNKDNNIYYDINFNILVNNARDISNLKFDLNSYDQIENFNKEIFLAVTLPYFLTTKLK